MRKPNMIKPSLAALLVLSSLGSSHAASFDSVRQNLAARMPGAQLGEIRQAPFGAGLYEVVVDGINILYTDAQANVAFIGKAIDLKTREDLAEVRSRELRRIDYAALPFDQAIVTRRGDGSRRLVVFSDPDCPFCRQLEKELAQLDNVTLHTFLLPLRELHPDAERKSALVWCAADRAAAWQALMLRGEEPAASADKDCAPPLEAIRAVADRTWITGTPALVFADGRMVPGMLPAAALEARLAEASQPIAPADKNASSKRQ